MQKPTPSASKNAKNRLFWKVGLLYFLMLLLVLIILDTYVVRTLKREYLEGAFSQLESLSRIALQKPPQSLNAAELAEWACWWAQSGIRVTLIANDGTVLADSDEQPSKMENHRERPEIETAFSTGSGRATSRSRKALDPSSGHGLFRRRLKHHEYAGIAQR